MHDTYLVGSALGGNVITARHDPWNSEIDDVRMM